MSKPHFPLTPARNRGVNASRNRFMADQPDPSIPPVPDVDALRKMLHRQTSEPDSVLDEIRRRVQSGEYLTREAAENAAKRMLDADEAP